VYKECISSNKKHRTALFRDLVHSFDPQTLERGDRKTATSASTPASKKSKGSDSGSRSDAAAPPVPDLELLSYTSQVLAFLPYAYPSDPLYIIHQIQQILSVQGPELVEAFASFLRPYGLADEDEYGDPLEGVDVIEEASTRPVPHHAKQVTVMLENAFDSLKFQNLCLQAGCLVLLLRLKQHLRHAYNLSETRCRHFDPQVKNSRESPIINKPSLSEFQSKLPLQNDSDPSSTNVLDGMIRMYAEFRKLMRSEIGSNSSGEESDSDNSNHDDTAMSKKKRRRSSAAGGGGGRCRRNVFDDENDDDDDDNNDGGDDE
jgi:cohesin loading factor subunit SCC2